jgi:hypothetical protein
MIIDTSLQTTLADGVMNPHIDYSWVPQQLYNLTGITMGTLIISLVGIFMAMALCFSTSKLGNFFDLNGSWGKGLITCLVCASLIASLPELMTWGSQTNSVPGGINTDSAIVNPSMNTGALNQRHGRKNHRKTALEHKKNAIKELKQGNIKGSLQSTIKSMNESIKEYQDLIKLGAALAQKRGVIGILTHGWKAIGNKVGKTWKWRTHR